MSTIVSELSTLPPVECAPWCEDGDGHPNAWHPADQWCGSPEVIVGLTRHALVDWSDDSKRLDVARAYLVRERFAAVTHLNLTHGDDSGMELTLEEAETFARGLLRLVETAREGGSV